MNREILFRGKRVDNGEWVFGHYILMHGKTTYTPHIQEMYGEQGYACHEVNPSTVCEYAGLTDKNGVKIFEGDIARGKYGSTVYQNEVIFAGDGFALRHNYDQYGYCASLEEHEGLEVIGNILDNTELLEEKINDTQ